MTQEIDPIVAKAVKLLLSNDEDSTEELRAHLEEQIRLRFGARRAQGIAGLLSPNSEFISSSSISGRKRLATAVSNLVLLLCLQRVTVMYCLLW